MNEFILGKPLSSKQIPDAPRCHNLEARRRALLKFPKPESPSTRIGAPVRSAILSTTSTTWVQDASLASRKPRLVDIESPDAHKPLNQPESQWLLREDRGIPLKSTASPSR